MLIQSRSGEDESEANDLKSTNYTADVNKNDVSVDNEDNMSQNNSKEISILELILWIIAFPIMFIRFIIKSDTIAIWAKVCIIVMIIGLILMLLT